MQNIDLNRCNFACKDCVFNYIKKHSLKQGDRFKVQCNGIPSSYFSEEQLAQLDIDKETAESMLNPVAWAAKFLDWHCIDPDGEIWKRKTENGTLPPDSRRYDPVRAATGMSIFHRPYQKIMLECSAKRKVFRLGRQCLAASSKIQLTDGTRKSIRDLKPGDELYSLNEETLKLEKDIVVDSWCSGKKAVYRIRTKFGHEIICSDIHPFFSLQGNCDYKNGRTVDSLSKDWISIRQGLKVGDKIAVPIKEEVFGNKFLHKSLPMLLGYFITDGSSSYKQSAKFTNTNNQYLLEFAYLCKELGSAVNPYPKGNGFDLIITNGQGRPNPVRDQLRALGLVNITGPEKFVPSVLFQAPQHQVRDFLNRFWAGDGYISTFQRTERKTFKTEIGTLQESKQLIEDIQCLLWRFGVHGHIKQEGSSWRLVVSNKLSVINFLKEIGPIFGKEVACEVALKNIDTISDKYCKFQEDILWDYVSSIEHLGQEDTYDIEVEKNHNFIANGLVTHNSGKSEVLVISILFALFTHANFKIVVIAPYQSQIDMIFGRINQHLDSSNILKSSISRNVKAPQYTVKLLNGSAVIGFTAGTRSGQEAGAARGQAANMICFAPGTLVNTSEFAAKPIETLSLEDKVLGGTSEDIFTGDILGLYKQESEIISVSTPLSTINVTPDHPLFNGIEDIPAKDAKEVIGSLAHQELSFREDAILARLCGYNFGDGSINHETQTAFFYGSSSDLEQISQDIVYLGGRVCYGEDRDSINEELNIEGTCATIGSRWAYKLLKDSCPAGRKVYQKLAIPNWVKNGHSVARRNFLSGLFSAEGSTLKYQKNGKSAAAIELRMTSSRQDWISSWVESVTSMLQQEGVRVAKTCVKKVKAPINKKKEPRWTGTVRLGNSQDNILVFAKNIGCCYSVEKRQKLNSYVLYHWYKSWWSKGCWKKNRQVRNFDYSLSAREVSLEIGIPKSTVRHHRKLRHYLFSEPELKPNELIDKLTIIKPGYVLLPILKNVPPRPRPSIVYNLTSGAGHRYWGNGLFTHNCFDECDYLSSGDIQATLATIINFPDATVWMSSTPTGRREKFYECCHDPLWKEYHFPSHVNPNFDEETDLFFKSQYTEDQYNHEINAKFGEMEEGVYKNKYIMEALADYEYGDIKPGNGWLYTIGVDWNDPKIGTTIAVVGYNSQEQQFYFVDQYVINAGNLTQLTACNKIAELTRYWQPFIVYIDRGHGVGQDEILRKYGMDAVADPQRGPKHPDAVLRYTKAYHFGGQIETYDLFSKAPVKKPAKPFLVENSVRRFETRAFKFPKTDEQYMKALQGYIVKRVSNAGAPVYEQQNSKCGDHMIDAVNLALVAFTLEKSEYGKPILDFSVSFTDKLTPMVDGVVKRTGISENTQPKLGSRTDNLFISDNLFARNQNVPGLISGENQGVKLWSWEGFGRDEPKPQTRTLRQAFQQAERKLGKGAAPRRSKHRPQRTKF